MQIDSFPRPCAPSATMRRLVLLGLLLLAWVFEPVPCEGGDQDRPALGFAGDGYTSAFPADTREAWRSLGAHPADPAIWPSNLAEFLTMLERQGFQVLLDLEHDALARFDWSRAGYEMSRIDSVSGLLNGVVPADVFWYFDQFGFLHLRRDDSRGTLIGAGPAPRVQRRFEEMKQFVEDDTLWLQSYDKAIAGLDGPTAETRGSSPVQYLEEIRRELSLCLDLPAAKPPATWHPTQLPARSDINGPRTTWREVLRVLCAANDLRFCIDGRNLRFVSVHSDHDQELALRAWEIRSLVEAPIPGLGKSARLHAIVEALRSHFRLPVFVEECVWNEDPLLYLAQPCTISSLLSSSVGQQDLQLGLWSRRIYICRDIRL